jgi:predicted O-methyltransferase YrrM
VDLPIYFTDWHKNFSYFFEDLKCFEGKTIKILHLGAYTGHGTKWMLEKVNGSCIDVDTWTGSSAAEGHLDDHEDFYDHRVEYMYDEQTVGLPTTKFKGTTVEFFAQNKETFDFIYIDASHKKADVALDLKESFKILNDGGIIACDDYLWTMNVPNVDRNLIPKDAIDEFISANSNKVEVLINNYQLWFKKISN